MAATVTSPAHTASIVSMDTIVTAQVLSARPKADVQRALGRALGWFVEVESVCSRFDPHSEVFALTEQIGRGVEVSTLLFEAVRFSLEVAEASGGLFDPTVGAAQARRGFDRNYVTGESVALPQAAKTVSYRDVELDAERRTVRLNKPLLIDLGAVAKGLAIDLAAKELSAFESMSIDAGGDVYVHGMNDSGEPWRIGVEHPRLPGVIVTIQLTEGSVCTSGDYARRQPDVQNGHHLLDPRSGESAHQAISCTVVAPAAMVADALSTAAFVAGPTEGMRLLEQQGVDGMIVSPALTISMTPGFERRLA